MRPSDFSRPFAISSPRRLPLAALRCGGREISLGKNAKLGTNPSPTRATDQRIPGFAATRRLTPRFARLTALRVRSVRCRTIGFDAEAAASIGPLLTEAPLPLV